MAKILLVTNPAHDDATSFLEAWSQDFINIAKARGDTVVELNGLTANRKVFEDKVRENNPQLIVINGHGNPSSVFGHGTEILVKCGDNEIILQKAIVHTMACNSADQLGPECIKIGTISYIGYKKEFKYGYSKLTTDKKSDPYAHYMFDPAFAAIIALVEGKTVEEAYEISQNAHIQELKKLVTMVDATHGEIASRVFHNLTHQVVLGNSKAQY